MSTHPWMHTEVEQIAHDAIERRGLTVFMLTVEPLPGGWRVLIVDAAGRAMTLDVNTIVPTAIRTELYH